MRKIHLAIGCIIIVALLPCVANAQVADIEGNTYKTVQIGSQLWMAENLKTTKYSNGTEIPLVTGQEWYTMTSQGYCWYNNDYKNFGKIYGALYNWAAIETGNLCPTGWHVPTDNDWNTLCKYLGGEKSAGGKLKESGTQHWKSPNAGATDSIAFSGPSGWWTVGHRTIRLNEPERLLVELFYI